MLNSFKNNIFTFWLAWHFWEVPKEIVAGWKNFLLFNLESFSIVLLVKTLFSYWHKYSWSYGRGFDFKVYLEAALSNLISRIIGAIIRIILIVIGIVSELFIFFAGLIILLAWLLLPFIIIVGIVFGFSLAF